MKHRAGFTLIELLIVIIILGILAAIALPRFTGAVESARAAEMMNFVGQVREQLNNWYSTHDAYTNNLGYLGFATGSGVTFNAGETVATLKYWTVSIDNATGTVQADRDRDVTPTDSPGADWATLTIAGIWGGDYWNSPGHPAKPE